MEKLALAPLFAALVLAGAWFAGRWLTGENGPWSRRRFISAAAGISVAYVFVDILPELAAHNRSVIEGAQGQPLLFAEQRIYVLALLSFVLLYGLEYIVLAAQERAKQRSIQRVSDRPGPLFALHIAGYALYCALISYLLHERSDDGLAALALYTLAMGVHFLIVDHALEEHHGEAYVVHGRWVLVASVLAGAALGVFVTLPDLAVARLFALLAGGVVITSLRSELPDQRTGRFWAFCLGALVYAVLLMLAE